MCVFILSLTYCEHNTLFSTNLMTDDIIELASSLVDNVLSLATKLSFEDYEYNMSI